MAALALLALSGGRALLAAPGALAGVKNPEQAHVDYMLKCQGCHQPQGAGDMAHTPPLKGEVGRFLNVTGGREFLARVPGVATADLSDERLAQLLNWTIQRFDGGNVPPDFEPYSTSEISSLRSAPLRLKRAEERARLVKAMKKGDPEK